MAEDMNKSAAETEEEYQPDLMTLEDEDGNEVTFEVIDALDHKGVHYLAVVEYAENEEDLDEDAQLVILSVGEDDEGEYLDVVEDDETTQSATTVKPELVRARFMALMGLIVLDLSVLKPIMESASLQ